MFSAPASVGITVVLVSFQESQHTAGSDKPHVRRGLDGGNELQSSISDTDDTDNSTWNNAEPALANDHGADKNVDYSNQYV